MAKMLLVAESLQSGHSPLSPGKPQFARRRHSPDSGPSTSRVRPPPTHRNLRAAAFSPNSASIAARGGWRAPCVCRRSLRQSFRPASALDMPRLELDRFLQIARHRRRVAHHRHQRAALIPNLGITRSHFGNGVEEFLRRHRWLSRGSPVAYERPLSGFQ